MATSPSARTLWAQEDDEHVSHDSADDAIQSFLEDQEEGEEPETVTVVEYTPTVMSPECARAFVVPVAKRAVEHMIEEIEDDSEYCAYDQSVDPAAVRSDLYQNLLAALEAIALWYPCSTLNHTGNKRTVNCAEWRKENP